MGVKAVFWEGYQTILIKHKYIENMTGWRWEVQEEYRKEW